MSTVENIQISHEDYVSGKYQSTSSNSGEHSARVVYNDDGSINEAETYSRDYQKKNKIGKYAEEKKESKFKKEAKKAGKEVKEGIKETISDFFCWEPFSGMGWFGVILYIICFPIILLWIIIRIIFQILF